MVVDKQTSVYSGKKLNIEIFGGSHSPEIGVNFSGLNGEKFDM